MSNAFVMQCPNCKHGIEITARSTRAPAISKSVVDKEENKVPKKKAPQADLSDLKELLSIIDDESLNPWERQFVSDTRQKFLKYGTEMFFNEKQMNKLRSIAGGDEEGF